MPLIISAGFVLLFRNEEKEDRKKNSTYHTDISFIGTVRNDMFLCYNGVAKQQIVCIKGKYIDISIAFLSY
jgi:hypothetical protein